MVLTPTSPAPSSTSSSVQASLRFGASERDSQTPRPGVFSPSIEPGFGQCAVSAAPSSSSTSAKKRL